MEGAVVTTNDDTAATDLAAEAALVAEALGDAYVLNHGDTRIRLGTEFHASYMLNTDPCWTALVALAKDRERWRHRALQHAPAVTGDRVVGGYAVDRDTGFSWDARAAQDDFGRRGDGR